MAESWIYSAVRTPFGRAGGALSAVRPDDMAAVVMQSAAEAAHLDPRRIDDVIFGDANQAGEDNRNVARFGALLAGFPSSVPGVTVNRLCGSSVEAVIQASRAVRSGDADIVLAGGVESMSRAPWVLQKSARAFTPTGNETLWNTAIGWRMVNPRLQEDWRSSNADVAQQLADIYNISREEQDEFALDSHRRALAAWENGIFDDEIVQIPGSELPRDEGIRPDTTMERLAALKAIVRPDGSVTAGNSSSINDGASAVLIAREGAIESDPLARISASAAFGNDPNRFGIAPVQAAERALTRAGRTWADVDLVELNEAFASQSLACIRLWPDVDPSKVNVHGGALAIGHPLGASGGRIVARAAHALKARGGGVAIVAICIGVGQGLAVVLER